MDDTKKQQIKNIVIGAAGSALILCGAWGAKEYIQSKHQANIESNTSESQITSEEPATAESTTETTTQEIETRINDNGIITDKYYNKIYTDEYGYHYIIDNENVRLYYDLSDDDFCDTYINKYAYNVEYHATSGNSRWWLLDEGIVVAIDEYFQRLNLGVNPARYKCQYGEIIEIESKDEDKNSATTQEATTIKETTTVHHTTTEEYETPPLMPWDYPEEVQEPIW